MQALHLYREVCKLSAQSQNNRLLASLPQPEQERLFPHLELVSLKLGEVVYESGLALEYAYFPIDCIVSLLYVMLDGDSSETAMVGNEGMVGVALFMGGEATIGRAVVQSDGFAFRLKAVTLKQEFKRSEALQNLLLRYAQALLTQTVQTAACNKHHSVPQQLIRWLLLGLDRLPESKLMMTQGLIANMLGVRRDGVGDAVGALQAAKLITYDNGTMTVLDRPRLEKAACECYFVVKKEFDRLLPDVKAS
ncbi:Crp/Fnr family transcriptional regulator [Stenotrophobium rhamnosiphilum]|uniref:Crp/Fnr family transcriptional regulator n=1 Tax=Stenotrophobium rhamnosiphilum TaxID=2029166 RepID=A0A2T5MF40_9GAMM|nr:Crp/Fnr family transcriptional regulator [Stenotrophobium rhamnosiphilum]